MISAAIGTVFVQESGDAARSQWRSVADQLRGKFPKLGVLINEAENDVLAFMMFSRAHWTQSYSTNPLEKLNAEIDAPEKAQAFGSRSKQHLADLCFAKPATVKTRTTDRYGRTVARVICNGTDASAEQVRSGMAWAFTKYLTDPSIKALEDHAHEARLGLWHDTNPVRPWEWRRRGRLASPEP